MRQSTIDKARAEVNVLDVLAERLLRLIEDEYRSSRDVHRYSEFEDAIKIGDIKRSLIAAYEEIANRGYGRVVLVDEVDENEAKLGAHAFRVSQANAGLPESPIGLIARNHPNGSVLASCKPGDQIEFTTPKGERFFNVRAVVDLDGISRILQQRPDAKVAEFREEGQSDYDTILGLRSFVSSLVLDNPPPIAPDVQETPPADIAVSPEFWLSDWSHVSFADEEDASLGSNFFTRTTKQQEEAIRSVRGLTIVQGIAGTGKTSVALGRLKFFSNFRSGENLDTYNLDRRDWPDFDARSMIGFVLSPSLVHYLRQTAERLEIGAMKIQDFEEFRNQERQGRHLFVRPYVKSAEDSSRYQGSIEWLRALDATAASWLAEEIAAIRQEPLTKPDSPDGRAISDLQWSDLTSRIWRTGDLPRRIDGIARRLASEPTVRAREFRLARVALDLDQAVRIGDKEAPRFAASARRVLREAVENVQLRMFRLLNPTELYVRVHLDSNYQQKLRGYLGASGTPTEDLNKVIERLESKRVNDGDVLSALCLNAISCEGFEREIRAIPYLASFAQNIGVFIDEVQDFCEQQVLLMGFRAKRKYWQITVAGDPIQQLHRDGVSEVARALPQVDTPARTIYLDQNMRQRSPLSELSSCIRCLRDPQNGQPRAECRAPLHVFKHDQDLAALWIPVLLSLPETARVAVVASSHADVERWFGAFSGGLEEGFRNPIISERGRLTERFRTHFTTPLDAKGLEFDAVALPDLGGFDTDDPIGLNSLYVAVSRPRYSLLLGCRDGLLERSAIQRLVSDQHLTVQQVPPADRSVH